MRRSILDDYNALQQRKAEIAVKENRGCLCCGEAIGVELEDSRTLYPHEGEIASEDDPNKPIPLCRRCAIEHHKHWDDLWDEYYRGLL